MQYTGPCLQRLHALFCRTLACLPPLPLPSATIGFDARLHDEWGFAHPLQSAHCAGCAARERGTRTHVACTRGRREGRRALLKARSPSKKHRSLQQANLATGPLQCPPCFPLLGRTAMGRPGVIPVFVGNISFDTTEEMVRDLFVEIGPVVAVRLVNSKDSGKPKGYGFVEFADMATAESAVRYLNGRELAGRAIRVDFAEHPDGSRVVVGTRRGE